MATASTPIAVSQPRKASKTEPVGHDDQVLPSWSTTAWLIRTQPKIGRQDQDRAHPDGDDQVLADDARGRTCQLDGERQGGSSRLAHEHHVRRLERHV